jgi:hypothetical protein
LYWDLEQKYTRITQGTKSIEDNITFERQKKGLIPVTSLDVGSEKLNIGIKVGIPGVVTDLISGIQREAKVFRAYNLINGGNVNVESISCVLSHELYEKFNQQGLLELNSTFSIPNVANVYKINLTGIKSANKRLFKSMSASEILNGLKFVADCKAKQHALNKLIKEVLGDKERVEFSNLSLEEVEIRKLLRIDENGIYSPAKVEKEESETYEIYPAIFLTYDVKFDDKSAKENYYNSIKGTFSNFKVGDDKIYKVLSTMLSDLKKDMRRMELAINSVRISSAIIGKNPFSYDVVTEKDKKTTDKALNRNMIVGGKVQEFKKIFEDSQDVILIKRWMQLIKCN